MRNGLALFATILAFGCDKPTAAPDAAAATPEPSVVVSAAPPAATSASPVAVVETPAPAASTSASPTVAKVAPKSKEAPAAPASASATAPAAPALVPASTQLTGKNFALAAATPGCRAGADCTMTLKLTATGSFHVNHEYPYKFTAAAAPNITFLGKGDAATFSRASGDFVEDNEKTATMTVRFRPAAAGDATVSGTYKLSVCSADQCQIEQQALALTVHVM